MRRFSIILPVYNGGEYIKLCINSILAQTYQHFNLIILDNHSNDGTTEWVSQLDDNRIFHYRSDVALSMTENWGRIISLEKNEFMTIIGHDDLLMPDYLEVMNALIDQYPDASLYQAHFNFIDENGQILRTCQPMESEQHVDEFLKCQMLQTLDSTGTGYMFRSADYDKIGGIPMDYPNLIFADYTLWMNLIAMNYKATSSKTCFEYRIHNSVSKLTNGALYCDAFEKYILFLTHLKSFNQTVNKVCEVYGYRFLMFFTESLSHRLLKTERNSRNITVMDYVKRCKKMSKQFIPGSKFHPLNNWKVMAAAIFDCNQLSRKIFFMIKRIK